MIYKKCIMTIAKNGATLDEDIYLYRLDKNVELHFTIVNNKYKFDKSDLNNIIAQTEAAYFQVRLYKNADIKYTFAIQPTDAGKAILKITDDLIDDPIEVGDYDFQISLLDEDKTSMISMPIVSKQLHVCEPLVSEDATMGKAVLGLSKLAKGEIKNAFDSEGNYIREIHQDGEIISASTFNKFEEALETNTKAIKNGTGGGGTGTSYDDTQIKNDIKTLKDSQINLVEDETSMEGIRDNEYPTLTTTNKTLIGAVNEVNTQCKDIKQQIADLGKGLDLSNLTLSTESVTDGTKLIMTDGVTTKNTIIPGVSETVVESIIQKKIDDGSLSKIEAIIEDESISENKLDKTYRQSLAKKEDLKFLKEYEYAFNGTKNGIEDATTDTLNNKLVGFTEKVPISYLKSEKFKIHFICSDNTPISGVIYNTSGGNNRVQLYKDVSPTIFSGLSIYILDLENVTLDTTDEYVQIGIVSEEAGKYLYPSKGIGSTSIGEFQKVEGGNWLAPNGWKCPACCFYNEFYGKTISETWASVNTSIDDININSLKKEIYSTTNYTPNDLKSYLGNKQTLLGYSFHTATLKSLDFDYVRFYMTRYTNLNEYNIRFFVLDTNNSRTLLFDKRLKLRWDNNILEVPFSNKELENITCDVVTIGIYTEDTKFDGIRVPDFGYEYDSSWDMNLLGINSTKAFTGDKFNTINTSVLMLKQTKISFLKLCNVNNELIKYFNLENTDEFYIPQNIDILKSDNLELFNNGCIASQNPEKYLLKIDDSLPYRKTSITSTAIEASTKVLQVIDSKTYKQLYKQEFNLITNSLPNDLTTSKNILPIGDSLTDWCDWITYFKNILTSKNITNKNIFGHKTNNFNNKCCALGGQTIDYFLGTSSPLYKNGKIDVKQYCKDCNVDNLDVAIIQLGWNSRTTGDTSSKMLQLAEYIHTDFPNCKIIFVGVQIPYISLVVNEKYSILLRDLYYTIHCNKSFEKVALEHDYIDFVNIAHQFDSRYSSKLNEIKVNKQSQKTTTSITDYIHPDTEGDKQIADAIFRCIVKYL